MRRRAPADWLGQLHARAQKVRRARERARRSAANQAEADMRLLVPANALLARSMAPKAPYRPADFGRVAAQAQPMGECSLFAAQFKWWWVEVRFASLLSPAQQRELAGALGVLAYGAPADEMEAHVGADGALIDQWPDKWPSAVPLAHLAAVLAALPPACVRGAHYGAACAGGECEQRCGVAQSNSGCCRPAFLSGGDWPPHLPEAPWYSLAQEGVPASARRPR